MIWERWKDNVASVESAACEADTIEWGRSPGFRGSRYSEWGQPHDTVVNRRMQNEWCKQPMRTSETTPWVGPHGSGARET